MIGEQIDQYRILERLGEGGMGTVYRALDTQLEREVALKVLRTDVADDPDLVMRFRAEAVALARLTHPNIATLHDLVQRESQLCMVMELVHGETLARLLQREGRLPWERAIDLTLQILAALEYAHALGVIHRDIKPSNVVIQPTGVAKLLDFGIARVLHSDHLTRQGVVLGTPRYMAPEQIRGEEVDGRADVYALGVLLYEMVAGRLPFTKDSGAGLMYAHLEGLVTPLPDVVPDTPPWLPDVVHRALATRPEQRYTASGLRQALEAGRAGRPIPSPAEATAATNILTSPGTRGPAAGAEPDTAAPAGPGWPREGDQPQPTPSGGRGRPAPSPAEPGAAAGGIVSGSDEVTRATPRRRPVRWVALGLLVVAISTAAVLWLRQTGPVQPRATLPAASFEDAVMLVPADPGYETVEVRVTFDTDHFVVFDLDANRVARRVYYRGTERLDRVVLTGEARLITGSDRWFVLPTSAGDVVLRLDFDATGAIVPAFEARSGMRAARVQGELTR